MKRLMFIVSIFVFFASSQSVFAADCYITDVIRCNIVAEEIYTIVENDQIIIYRNLPYQEDDEVVTSITFNEIFQIVQEIGDAGEAMVKAEQLDQTASLKDLRDKAIELNVHRKVRDRILPNGNIHLIGSEDEKANIYLLANSPVVQINIGPDIEGNVQVLILTLFNIPVFYDFASFNIYHIDFASQAAGNP